MPDPYALATYNAVLANSGGNQMGLGLNLAGTGLPNQPPAPSAPQPAPPPPPQSGGYTASPPPQNMSVAPGGMSVQPPAPPPQAPPQQQGAPIDPGMMSPQLYATMQARQVSGGGYTPAHEANMFGPTQWNAIAQARAVNADAAERISERQQEQAKAEEYMAFRQAQSMQAQADGQAAAMARREEEATQRLADMDETVKQLSAQSVDPNHFWATRDTGSKIGAVLGIALGGFVSGSKGGPNEALGIVNQAIDRDIRAQEFNIQSKMKGFDAQKSAYGAMMEKYNSVDAARAMTRAAMLDVVQRQTAQLAATQKGAEAKNGADQLMAKLEEDKRNWIMQGLKYVQAQSSEPRYRVPGLPFPVTRAELVAMHNKGMDGQQKLVEGDQQADREIRKEQAQQRGKLGEKADDGARFIAEKMQTADLPGAKAASEEALRTLTANKPGVLERVTRWGGAADDPTGLAKKTGNLVGGTENGVTAAEREQAWSNYKNRTMKALMGNVTAGEEGRAKESLEGAGSPEERMNAIKQTEKMLGAAEKNIMAGASPESQRIYMERVQQARGSQSAPQGSKRGWSK